MFILIGLQLPFIVEGLGDYSLRDAIRYAFCYHQCSYNSGAVVMDLSCSLFPVVKQSHSQTGTRSGLERSTGSSWSGMRGVVSLASALSIPLLANGVEFPHRNLILFITFIVILCTLHWQD